MGLASRQIYTSTFSFRPIKPLEQIRAAFTNYLYRSYYISSDIIIMTTPYKCIEYAVLMLQQKQIYNIIFPFVAVYLII